MCTLIRAAEAGFPSASVTVSSTEQGPAPPSITEKSFVFGASWVFGACSFFGASWVRAPGGRPAAVKISSPPKTRASRWLLAIRQPCSDYTEPHWTWPYFVVASEACVLQPIPLILNGLQVYS